MGDLLFYLLKSGCYLIIFYLLFKLLMSGTTFFRFNRVTILAGIIGCMFLPLIEFTTQEETFLTVPLQTIQGIFVEQADGIFWPRFVLSHAARYSERSSDSGQDAAGSQVCPFQRISGKLHADKGGCLITYYLFHTLYIYK